MSGPSPWPSVDPGSPRRPNKRLGQHFLVNRGVLRQIVDAADLANDDVVIEVGPGLGVLTRELARRSSALVAIEVDRSLFEHLRGEFASEPRVHLVHGDILEWPPARLLAEAGRTPDTHYKVVANLPYYITAPVLRHFLTDPHPPRSMVAMVQYEVARRLAAGPGEMSLLAAAVQFYGRVEFLMTVSPGSFSPPPKVRSAVIRVTSYSRAPVDVPSEAAFFETVRAGFSARRKQLQNALANGWRLPAATVAAILAAAGIDPRARAETLSLEQWARLAWAREVSRA